MNTQRLTISIPNYLYEVLMNQTQPRQTSRFVAQAIEKELLEIKNKKDPIDDFLAFAKKNKIAKLKTEDILKAIRKGRL